jgi:molecular chaperone Hsp33
VASCLEHYFELSEQLPTRLMIASNEGRASGLLLQVMPGHDAPDSDGWNRVTQLASTLTEDELLILDHPTLITRLFHEELVRLFDPRPLRFNCSCSRERTAQALVAIGAEEARDIIAERGQIDMHCQFCRQHYQFDADDVAALFAGSNRLLH